MIQYPLRARVRSAFAAASLSARRATGAAGMAALARSERASLIVLVAVPIAFNAIALWPELTVRVPDVNDDAEHLVFIRRASDAFHDGTNALDPWVRELELGYPQFLTYQHLPHLLVIGLERASLGLLDLQASFALIRYTLLVTLPLTVLWSMRWMRFPLPTAAFAAAAASLISGSHRYGFEYDSYVWRGFGLFTQVAGMHLSFVLVAMLQQLIARRRGVLGAGLVAGLLTLSHLIYAYMAAISAMVFAIGHFSRTTIRTTVARGAVVAAIALTVSAYLWTTFPAASPYLNVSPFIGRERLDSFGAATVVGWLASGDLLDHGRAPVLTLLLAMGLATALLSRHRSAVVLAVLFGVWVVLYSGRPTFGPLVDLLPLSATLLFHRFIGGVHLFAIFMIGIAGGALWLFVRRWGARSGVGGVALLALALMPAMVERASYYEDNRRWMVETATAIEADTDASAAIASVRGLPGTRVYAGRRSDWGTRMNFGLAFNSVKLFNLFAWERIDALAPPYRSASLNSDLVFLFDERRASHARTFAVERVIAPASLALPAHFVRLATYGKYSVFAAPGRGLAEFGEVTARRTIATQEELHSQMQEWLLGPGPDEWRFTRFDLGAAGDDAWRPTPACPTGRVDTVRVVDGHIGMLAECPAESTIVVKTTYHPNWQATVDGKPARTFQVSPSFLAVTVPAGAHFVEVTYVPSQLKVPLAWLGLLTGTGVAILASRRTLRRLLARGTRLRRPRLADLRRG